MMTARQASWLLLLGAAVLGVLLPGVSPRKGHAQEADGTTARPASEDAEDELVLESELRRCWILHRLQGDEAAALEGYEALLVRLEALPEQDPRRAPLLARTRIGMAMIARLSGDPAQARKRLIEVTSEATVPVRWKHSAVSILDEMSREQELSEHQHRHELETFVSDLEKEHRSLQEEFADRESTIGLLRDTIQRLEVERTREPREIPTPSDQVSRMMDSMLEERRNEAEVERYVIEEALRESHEYFEDGKYLLAYNAARRVIQIAPLNKTALDLMRKCNTLVGLSTTRRSVRPGEDPPIVAASKKILLESVRQHVERGRSLYRDGLLSSAIDSMRQALHEYAWSGVILTEDEMHEFIQPAHRYLEKWITETTVGETVVIMAERETKLLQEIIAENSALASQESELEEVRSDLDRIKGADPEKSLQLARQWVKEYSEEAMAALDRGDRKLLLRSLRDMEFLFENFPDLGSKHAEAVSRMLESLEGNYEP